MFTGEWGYARHSRDIIGRLTEIEIMAEGWTGVELRDPNILGYEAKHPWRFACPKPYCYWSVCANTELDAQKEEREHPCPHSGSTKIGWTVTRTLVEQVWDLLDIETGALLDGHKSDTLKYECAQARARALAEVLAIFMPPHFTTADAIVREAVIRFKAKQKEEKHETAGLGNRRYEGAEEWTKARGGWTSDPEQARKEVGEKRTTPTGPRQPHAIVHLGEVEQNAIRQFNALDPNKFTKEVLAKTYGVSAVVIETVLKA